MPYDEGPHASWYRRDPCRPPSPASLYPPSASIERVRVRVRVRVSLSLSSISIYREHTSLHCEDMLRSVMGEEVNEQGLKKKGQDLSGCKKL